MLAMLRHALLFTLLAFTGVSVAAIDAHTVVEQTTNSLLADLKANKDKYRTDPAAFYTAMDTILGPVVDADGISKSVMTVRYSRRATPAQMQRFQENFKRSLMQFYGNALLEYDNQSIRVLPGSLAQGDMRSEVRMEVTDHKGIVYPVSYTMVKIDNQWRMRNVVLNGINLGKLFRDQFAEAMQRNAHNLDRVIDSWVDTVAKTRAAEEEA
ncbi:MAG: ABC transporter substrate-binding protein [Gammaproteobacteria bacterium]|jgi:phospholipid transport system substrate-binding protein|nr:ABC transporter substrate-binding protein [Pseudomonas sp.]MDY0414893.1 ABC transporter substrate-binding protein [Pseudomonas sp.]NLO53662.1 ABC transporter substrate-binding protein [Gammaproteobacteria bacterium]